MMEGEGMKKPLKPGRVKGTDGVQSTKGGNTRLEIVSRDELEKTSAKRGMAVFETKKATKTPFARLNEIESDFEYLQKIVGTRLDALEHDVKELQDIMRELIESIKEGKEEAVKAPAIGLETSVPGIENEG